MLDDLFVGLWFREPLQELLEHEPRAADSTCIERSSKFLNFRQVGRSVPTKRKRPDAGIDEYVQRRVRSAL